MATAMSSEFLNYVHSVFAPCSATGAPVAGSGAAVAACRTSGLLAASFSLAMGKLSNFVTLNYFALKLCILDPLEFECKVFLFYNIETYMNPTVTALGQYAKSFFARIGVGKPVSRVHKNLF